MNILTAQEKETSCIVCRDFKKEHELGQILSKDNGATLHIQYMMKSSNPILAFTYNPKSKTSFGIGKFRSYDELEEYLKRDVSETSYTVVWSTPTDGTHHQSYFYAKNISDVLDKFYGVPANYRHVVHEVRENPES